MGDGQAQICQGGKERWRDGFLGEVDLVTGTFG